MSNSARDMTTIHREIEDFRRRVSVLQEHADREVGAQSTTLLTLIEELHIAVAELLTNEEEFRLKQEQWTEVQERLRTERQYYADLFDQAPDAYLVTTAAGVIRHANVSASVLLKTSKVSLTGKPLLVFVADTHKRLYLDQLDRLRNPPGGVVRNWNLSLHPPNGTPIMSASVNVTAQYDSRQQVDALRWSIRESSNPS